MRDNRLTMRITQEDAEMMGVLRDHLRRSDPWPNRTRVFRFALVTAVAALNEQAR